MLNNNETLNDIVIKDIGNTVNNNDNVVSYDDGDVDKTSENNDDDSDGDDDDDDDEDSDDDDDDDDGVDENHNDDDDTKSDISNCVTTIAALTGNTFKKEKRKRASQSKQNRKSNKKSINKNKRIRKKTNKKLKESKSRNGFDANIVCTTNNMSEYAGLTRFETTFVAVNANNNANVIEKQIKFDENNNKDDNKNTDTMVMMPIANEAQLLNDVKILVDDCNNVENMSGLLSADDVIKTIVNETPNNECLLEHEQNVNEELIETAQVVIGDSMIEDANDDESMQEQISECVGLVNQTEINQQGQQKIGNNFDDDDDNDDDDDDEDDDDDDDDDDDEDDNDDNEDEDELEEQNDQITQHSTDDYNQNSAVRTRLNHHQSLNADKIAGTTTTAAAATTTLCKTNHPNHNYVNTLEINNDIETNAINSQIQNQNDSTQIQNICLNNNNSTTSTCSNEDYLNQANQSFHNHSYRSYSSNSSRNSPIYDNAQHHKHQKDTQQRQNEKSNVQKQLFHEQLIQQSQTQQLIPHTYDPNYNWNNNTSTSALHLSSAKSQQQQQQQPSRHTTPAPLATTPRPTSTSSVQMNNQNYLSTTNKTPPSATTPPSSIDSVSLTSNGNTAPIASSISTSQHYERIENESKRRFDLTNNPIALLHNDLYGHQPINMHRQQQLHHSSNSSANQNSNSNQSHHQVQHINPANASHYYPTSSAPNVATHHFSHHLYSHNPHLASNHANQLHSNTNPNPFYAFQQAAHFNFATQYSTGSLTTNTTGTNTNTKANSTKNTTIQLNQLFDTELYTTAAAVAAAATPTALTQKSNSKTKTTKQKKSSSSSSSSSSTTTATTSTSSSNSLSRNSQSIPQMSYDNQTTPWYDFSNANKADVMNFNNFFQHSYANNHVHKPYTNNEFLFQTQVHERSNNNNHNSANTTGSYINGVNVTQSGSWQTHNARTNPYYSHSAAMLNAATATNTNFPFFPPPPPPSQTPSSSSSSSSSTTTTPASSIIDLNHPSHQNTHLQHQIQHQQQQHQQQQQQQHTQHHQRQQQQQQHQIKFPSAQSLHSHQNSHQHHHHQQQQQQQQQQHDTATAVAAAAVLHQQNAFVRHHSAVFSQYPPMSLIAAQTNQHPFSSTQLNWPH